MAPTVPTPEEFLASFPLPAAKIEGTPTYESLRELRDTLKINASSVPSSRGGGAHGYLGLVLSSPLYATIDPTPFNIPNNPGLQPIIPRNAIEPALGEIVRLHTEQKREWNEYNSIHSALKKQLINAIDPIYLRSKRDRHVGFNNIALREILNFLFTTYGSLQPQDLAENFKRLNQPWDPNTPLETLINQIEEGMEFAEAGNQALTDRQIVNTAYTLVFQTGLYFDDCKNWNRKTEADRTWINFKSHFLEAQREVRLQQQTAKQAGFSTANALYANQDNQYRETAEALANLATATSSDRQAFAALVVTNSQLSEQLTAALNEIRGLKKILTEKRPGQNNSNNRNTNPNQNYCWTHGFKVANSHTSASCKQPAQGHKHEATRANTMGGSTKGKE